ncbi:hypothetical protein [Pyxidicoccus xibeiensis]|uniref:hypothetical protein n=1 Tax=Pyxidicoccus xibeiensis TaxID=2906759 RepID=UPI0020A76A6B|nr:hypothetical protein [Pyxidicoccus xibeiensis]MCP3143840.1 hypothetical protein [Pyxidicoccus xibeiensis]
MLTKLQSRLRQFTSVAPPPPKSQLQAQKGLGKPGPDAMSTPQLTESRNPALRTLGGDSLFETTRSRAGEKAGQLFQMRGPGGLEKQDPAELREQAVEEAIAGKGKPVDFVNSDGKTEQVAIFQVPFAGEDTYFVRVGDETFQVEFQGGTDADREAFLAQVIDSYSETPPELRSSLQKVVVTPDQGPETATGNRAAATAGDGTITFYDDGRHLSEDIFHHELGHLIGRQQEEKDDGFWTDLGEVFTGEPPPVPDGWDEAAMEDENFTSGYAETDYKRDGNYTEDFAEAWKLYMAAIDGGPEKLAEFREMYPERAEILEDIYPPPEQD